jgi:EmrB/QacA subfamily drug resistance transporter
MSKRSVPRKWLGLAALMPALAMVFVDQAVLPVALPTIQEHLGATHVELWWCINSYLLVSAIFMLPGGKLGDRLGYRNVFLSGTFIFALSSFLCALSFNVAWLIGARALQGVGAALMIPATSPLIMSLFPQKERGKAVGLNASISSLFLVTAPLIGGYFTQEYSWRWIFWINLPLAILALILVYVFISESEKKERHFDVLGFSFFTVALSFLVTLIMQGSEWGWTSMLSVCFFVLSLISSFLLVRRERKVKNPFVDIGLFKHPVYKAVNISVFATQFVLMITIYRAFFFQDVMGWSPIKVGFVFSATSLPVLFMSLVGGWLADKFGPKIPIAAGFLLLIFSFFWSTFFVESSLFMLVVGFLGFGFGVPLIFTPTYSSAMGSVPPSKSGSAFGIIATVRVASGTIAVAIISAFVKQIQWQSLLSKIRENPLTKSMDLTHLKALSLGDSCTGADLSGSELTVVMQYIKESEIHGYMAIHVALGMLLMVAFSFVFVLYRRKASHHLPETPAEGWD